MKTATANITVVILLILLFSTAGLVGVYCGHRLIILSPEWQLLPGHQLTETGNYFLSIINLFLGFIILVDFGIVPLVAAGWLGIKLFFLMRQLPAISSSRLKQEKILS